MDRPAHEHEGPLSDPRNARAGDIRTAAARKIVKDNLLDLSEDGGFLLWFQRYAYPMLAMDFPVNNGSLLAHFMGRRQMVMQIVQEMDEVNPGFLGRVLHARDEYEKQLLAAERAKEQ